MWRQEFLSNQSIGRAHNVPEKQYRFHNNDHPWTNEKHKRLINSDNEPLLQVNFKYYRNKVNRQRKSCLASFCISKVENLKQLNPNDCMVSWGQTRQRNELQLKP